MEPIQGKHETSMFAPEEDFISNMPDNVVTNILDRLPLQDAVRTGILARYWRFKWTMLISQLVFDEDFFQYLSKTKAGNNQVRVIVSRILLQLRGAITKCVLSIDNIELDVEDENIIHWILFLCGKGVKDLTLEHSGYETPWKLPIQFFSCLEFKHLKLHHCCFSPPPIFHGFPNLLSLELSCIGEGGVNGVGEVISRCPLLEILKLDSFFNLCKVKLEEFARLENLKILSLSLLDLDSNLINCQRYSTIFELLGSLPKLQELELNFIGCKLLEGVANKRFSIAFPCLKVLRLSNICLENGMMLSCAFDLINSCPNLQTLGIITANNWDIDPPPQADYITTGLSQLRSVMFEYLKGSENELCLLKYLLASSPFLKKIVICSPSLCGITLDEKLKFACKLLKLHRASPVVDIDLS